MIFLINLISVLIPILGCIVVYKIQGWKWKGIAAVTFIVTSLLYMQIQPSYMPKGTVKPLPNPEFHVNDSPMVDRLMKPKSGAEYDAERNKALEDINTSINEQIKLNKE
jgi:hypothetical protein